MDPKKLKWLEDINFIEYLGLVEHHVTLNKDLWDRQHYSDFLEDAMRSFTCNECDQRATVVDFKTKKFYCDDHSSLMDSWKDNIRQIDEILNRFQRKLNKVEKILILVQERELYFKNNKKKKRITEKEKNKIQFFNLIDIIN